MGTNDNRDHLAGFLEMIIPFALVYGLRFATWKKSRVLGLGNIAKAALFLILAATIFAAIILTLSKAGFVSTLFSLFAMGVVAVSTRLVGSRRWAAFAGLAALLFALFVFLPSNALVSDYGSLTSDQTGEGRLPIAKDTLYLIAAYPLFGSGLGTFYPAFMRYQTYGLDLAWLSPHNDYLEFQSELGLVGSLLLASFVCAVLTCAIRASVSGPNRDARLLGLACTGGLVAILIHSVADFNMHIPANALVLIWISAIAITLPVGPVSFIQTPEGSSLIRVSMLIFGVLAGVYGAGSLLYTHRFQGNLKAERLFCRFGICDSYQAVAKLKQQYGGAASVPPDQLMSYLQRDPTGPYLWTDVGASLQNVGRFADARYCFERSVVLAPHIPSVLSKAAQFFLSQGEENRGFELTRRILKGNPDWLTPADFGSRVTLDHILKKGLPADSRAWRSALLFEIRQNHPPEATTVWNALLARGYADEPTALQMITFLLNRKEPASAARAWADYQGSRSAGYLQSNYVYNGGFESDPVGPFDWTLQSNRPGLQISIDSGVAHSGSRSARVIFDGSENVETIDLSQSAFAPAGSYKFQAFVKLDGITTDQGVSFEISGEHWKVETENLVGTQDWRLVQTQFKAPTSGLVQVRLFRRKSWRFDSSIKGTIWIDNVSIAPTLAAKPATPQMQTPPAAAPSPTRPT